MLSTLIVRDPLFEVDPSGSECQVVLQGSGQVACRAHSEYPLQEHWNVVHSARCDIAMPLFV